MKLTVKQEKFCTGYIETGNASEAYRRAYNAGKMSSNAIHVAACRLLALPKIALRIEKLQETHQKRHDVTVDSLTKEYEEARELAKEEKQPAAMVGATTGKAKLHGLVTDKQERTGKDGGPIETKDVSRETIVTEVDKIFTDPTNGARDGAKVLH